MTQEQENALIDTAKQRGYQFGTMLRTDAAHLGIVLGLNMRWCVLKENLLADGIGTDGNMFRNVVIHNPSTGYWAPIQNKSPWAWR